MTQLLDALSVLPTAALVALGVLFVIQLSLQIFCLVDLSRRDRVPGGRKWVWALVIVFGQLLGAIAYLAVGRSVPPEVDTTSRGTGDEGAARRAVDSLYGNRPER